MALLNFSWRTPLPVILQTEKTECGLACIAMVLNFYGHRIDLNSLRVRYAISQHGTTLRNLMVLADKVQLSSRPLRLEPADFPKLKLPAILHWDMHHFVVLAKVSGKGCIIHDPAIGVKHYTFESLGRNFTGIALELTPTEVFECKVDERKLSIRDLWTRTTGMKRSILQLLVLSLLMQGFSLALPFYSQIVIDDVLVSFDLQLLEVLALGFLLITLLNVATDFIRSYVAMHMSNSLGFQLAANVNRHLLRLPLDYFAKRHMGDIVSRFGSLYRIKDFITSGIIEAVIDGLMVLGTFTLILVYSIKLSMLVVVILAINSIAKFSLYGPLRNESEALLAATARENTTFMENIRSIQGIKLFGKELDRNSVWQNIYAEVTNKGISVQKLNIYTRLSRSLIFGVENVLILFMAASLVLAGELSVGMMIAFLSYKEQLYKRFFGLIDKYFDYRMLDVHLGRLADIAYSKPEPTGTWMYPVERSRMPEPAGTPMYPVERSRMPEPTGTWTYPVERSRMPEPAGTPIYPVERSRMPEPPNTSTHLEERTRKTESATANFFSAPAAPDATPFFEAKSLSFRYADDAPYLFQNLNLTVRANESVAIIGPTGCGKSTLLRLLLSLYQPESGSLSLHAIPISVMGLEHYRSNISGVLQDDALLSGTLFDNISFFDPQPDRTMVEAAAAQAAIAPEIERLPMRYETLVGNMGAALSGGQVQRILLARTFYKRSRLIILDEATSHLDLDTEAAVNRSIKQMQAARIMVAHRPQSYMLADTIYQLTPSGLVLLDKTRLFPAGFSGAHS
jgi:ATP-binding cassette, subfamily B, bacterial CvaB/MchF/RaxB